MNIEKPYRSLYPLTVVPTVDEEDNGIPFWSSTENQSPAQGSSPNSLTSYHDEVHERCRYPGPKEQKLDLFWL